MLQRCGLAEFSFSEQTLQTLVIAVGLLVLDQKPDEVGMGISLWLGV